MISNNKDNIKLIVGLGNPEPEYSNTRHNLGFDVINRLQEISNIKVKEKKFNSLFGIGKLCNNEIILLKPQTYMNNSGMALVDIIKKYNLKPEQILVIYDDMDIEVGKIKLRKQGNSGSHNGVKSIIYFMQSNKFPRIRIGIGRPDSADQNIDYVIGKLSDEKKVQLNKGVELAKDAVVEILENGMDFAMNKFN